MEIVKNFAPVFRTGCVEGITADYDRMAAYAHKSPSLATALNPVLTIGTQMVEESPESYERVFLIASALGLAATLASLGLLWRRSESRGTDTP